MANARVKEIVESLRTKFRAFIPFLKELLSPAYIFRPRYALVLVAVGVPANFFFCWYETSLGYWDHLWIRSLFSLSLMLIPIVAYFVPWKTIKVIYWEFALFCFFPVMNTLYLLQNGVNKYWFSTYILDMFFLGLFTKYYLVPLHFLLGCGLVTYLHLTFVGALPQVYSDALQAHTAAALSALVANVFSMVMDYALRKGKQAEAARVRAAAAEEREKALLSSNEILRTYTRPSLVDVILKGGDPRKAFPEEKDLTILFADIRDFTGTTEKLNAYERLQWLNSYFTMGTRCINDAGGEVDKYMGDCLMAIFDTPRQAVDATIAFRKEFQQYNQYMIEQKDERYLIRSGAGIARGPVVRGNIGSHQKMDLTVIGSAVNIASRIESLTKVYNLEILVTEDVVKDLGPDYPHCRWIDNVQVKGSKTHLKIFEIYGHQSDPVRAYKDETRDILEKALTIYFGRGFNDAERLFRALQKKAPPHTYLPDEPMDRICEYFINRCAKLKEDHSLFAYYLQHWDGVHVFNEK